VVPVGTVEGEGVEVWYHFEETVTAKYGVEEVALNIGAGSPLGKVRNIKVERVFEPKVLLRRVGGVGRNLEETPRINFVKIDPTKYKVRVEGAKNPFTLVFNETFHPGWRIYKNQQPVLADHFLVNWYANAWDIKPEDVGGAENFELMVEFWPQRLFYLGLLVSGLTLVGCSSCLAVARGKRCS
jgi:hypothetical protein